MYNADSGADAARPSDISGADLVGVDPRRWVEARRRIDELNAWTKKSRHSNAECERAAERLGLTPKHFMRLVSAWKKHGDATRISALGVKRGEARGRRDLSVEARRAVEEAINLLGPDARFKDVVAEVAIRSTALGVKPASNGMVHNLLMRARGAGGGRGPGMIRVAKIFCMLPTITSDGSVEPSFAMIVAVFHPRNDIIAYRLIGDGNDLEGATQAILRDPGVTAMGLPIEVSRELAHGRPAEAESQVTVSKSNEILVRALGSRVGTLPIRHRQRRGKGNADTASAAAIHAPLSRTDTETAVRIAIGEHNRKRQGGEP